ncbi:transducin beta-like protein 3 [Chenopodium quinoa]|uniref:U3 small nucleolar RNA-associated protein 13 C-terminal domain-containing protein n=1 Tax=Chenopodium quinoa TaxID=63459 RepID=A0A803MTD4_CHEQI|nr:transducin beta-like protein 3 [Chenopodium quinoa]
MAALSYKKSYRTNQSLQQFYTGGPFTVSSDGTFLVCTCDDSIKIVDSSNASIKSTIEGDSEPITALALSPDDKFLFSASHSRQIRVWDLSTLKCIRSWKGHDGPVMAMACDASGGLLATAGADRKVLVWDVDGGFCTHYFKGHKGVVTCIMFHPDPDCLLLFSGSDDASVRVWDLITKKCAATMEKHFSAVVSLAMSEDRRFLLSAGRDKVVNMWDLKSYGCKTTIPTYEVLEAVCVINSGTVFYDSLSSQRPKKSKNIMPEVYFLTAGERGIVRIWNTEGAVCLFEQKTSDVAFSPDENDLRRGFTAACMLPSDEGLLCITADQQFLFYSPLKHSEEDLCLSLCKRLIGYNEEIVDMKFLGEDENFLAVATNLEQVRVYDLASMSCSYVLAGHTGIVLCLDTFTTTSGTTLIVTGSKDNSVRLWDSESKRCLGVGNGHTGAVGAVASSKKLRNFFVSGSSDRTIKVWSIEGLDSVTEEPISLKAKAVVAAHDKDINSLAIAPFDSYVCSGSQDRTACIWKLPDLVCVAKLKGHKRGIWSVEFSPVDKCVLTASGDKTIKMWTLDGSCLKTFEGHTSSVLRASFITRGTQFVSSGADGLLKLWAVTSSECIATYDEHEDKVWALAIGKKTEMLATGGGDAVINIWNDSTAAEKEEAFRKEEEGVLRGQELENAISDADYAKAIQIAFELRRPHRLYELLSELCRKKDAVDHLKKALLHLGKEEMQQLFEYIREWNTKPKLCHNAQFVLFQIFSMLPPTDIVEVKGIGELLEGLIPYSQRHFSRVDRLERSTFLLDYTLIGMSVIEPEGERRNIENNSDKKVDKEDISSDPVDAKKDSATEPAVKTHQKKGSKKRKSKKSSEVSNKKVKNVPTTESSAVSLQA